MGFFDSLFGKKETKPAAAPDSNGGGPEMMAPADVQNQQSVENAEQGQGQMPPMTQEEKGAMDQIAAPEQPGNGGQ